MASFRNPMFEAEPYEESQGGSPKSDPAELQAFYEDMERKEIIERKLSKRKSSSGKSMWSRKSVKRNNSTPTSPISVGVNTTPAPSASQLVHEKERELEAADRAEEHKEKRDQVPVMILRSIIPDPLNELPSWYTKDNQATGPFSYRIRYPIHNPVGPRYYRNYHLIPPAQLRPSARPPSFFSPSFPPMTTSTLNDPSEDATRLPGLNRTPSGSPLPTPDSSQTRIGDGQGKRSRKTSQTTPDNVDLLDVTDPWGSHWHHQSPYDIQISGNNAANGGDTTEHTRSRNASMTASQTRHKTVIPSPLSQSTSAVHLQIPPEDLTGARIPRKLSKKRAPAIGNLFGSEPKESDTARNAVSLPTTPLETADPAQSLKPLHISEPKRKSAIPHVSAPSVLAPSTVSQRKERRGSILGRIAKKFSLMRKPAPANMRNSRATEDDWHHVGSDDARSDRESRRSAIVARQASPEKSQPDQRKSPDIKRVPPPSLTPDGQVSPNEGPSHNAEASKDSDCRSSLSIETPFSIGRLTIANPDTPSSGDNTPTQQDAPLPPEKPPMSPSPLSVSEHRSSSTPIASPIPAPIPSPIPVAPVSDPDPIPTLVSSLVAVTEPQAREDKPIPPIPDQSPAMAAMSPVPSISQSQVPPTPSPQVSSIALDTPATSHLETQRHRSQPGSSKPTSPTSPVSPRTETSKTRHPVGFTEDYKVTETRTPPESLKTQSTARPHKQKTSSAPSIPFPAVEAMQPVSRLKADATLSVVNDSPLSISSMLVNPPTPHTDDTPIPVSPAPAPPAPSKSRESKRSPREPSPGGQVSATIGRQTETFRLVRSPSGNVYASGETIRAEGEQWEFVESQNDTKDRSSKSKDRDGSRREQRRQEKVKADTDADQRKTRSQGKRDSANVRSEIPAASGSGGPHRSTSADIHRRPGIPEALVSPQKEPSKSSRKRDGDRDRERKLERKATETLQVSLNVDKPQPAPPPPTPGPSGTVSLERRPSASARPTSELPSSADLNAMRAREAWEMERLWKAKSMYGPENRGLVSESAPLILEHSVPPGKHEALNGARAVHGSSHTSFMVQTPFQQHQPPHIYHSMPVSPPPIIYSSTPTLPHLSTHSSYNSNHHSYPNSLSDPLNPSSRPPNPLPEPPRESPYEPAPLPPVLFDANASRSADYWIGHSGLTTAH